MNTTRHHSFTERLFQVFPPPRLLAMPATSIDISDQTIRYLELVDTKEGLRIKRHGLQTFPEGLVMEGKIEQKEVFTKELQKLSNGIGLDFVRVSLPEEQAYLFQAALPPLTEGQSVRTVIEFQLEENIPIPSENAIFDYEIIHRNPDGGMEVNVAAYSADIIFDYVEAFAHAGMTPLSFEVEAQAIARAIVPRHEKKTCMVIDFGKSRTGIGIVSDGTLRYTSTIEVGGVSLTKAIQKYFNVDEKEADKIKNEKGFAHYRDNVELFESLMNTVSALKDEVYRRYIYWNTHLENQGGDSKKIEKIILCGGSANLAGLPDYLSTGLGVPVEVANVWRNVFSLEEYIPPIDRHSSLAYATVVGLALRNFE